MRITIAGGTGVIGRQIVAAARDRGHDPLVLARSTGVDLYAGTGLDQHLAGSEVVIDVTSVLAVRSSTSIDFFRTVTQHLVTAGRRCGVRHHLALSILGARQAPFGYYAGKSAQEDLVLHQPNGTIVRSAQFHEFAQQTLARTRVGRVHVLPRMRSQPVATQEVADLLLDVAQGAPRGDGPSIAGPQEWRVADMARRTFQHDGAPGRVIELPFPGSFGRALRDGTLLPDSQTLLGRLTFDSWLNQSTR